MNEAVIAVMKLAEENAKLRQVVAAQEAIIASYVSTSQPLMFDPAVVAERTHSLPNSSQGYIHPRLRARE